MRTDRAAQRRRRVADVCAILCGCLALLPSGAAAQCATAAILERHVGARPAPTIASPPTVLRSAAEVTTWKTVVIGTFRDSIALRNALDAQGCGVGDGAAQVMARPAFAIGRTPQRLGLSAVTAEQLGFVEGMVPLEHVYAKAQQLGFALAPAEAGPQLRLQYLEQRLGEFMIVGMAPIETWSGERLVFVVANGGAGLVLLSQDAQARVYSKAPIVFAHRRRGDDVALDEPAASPRR